MSFPNSFLSTARKSATQTVTAGAVLSATSSLMNISSAGGVTTDTVTPIEAGTADGQVVTFINTGANNITIKNGGNVQAVGDVVVATLNSVSYIWLSSTAKWYQTNTLVNNV